MDRLLDKPLPLKTLTLRNRIAMPPMATELSVNDVPSDALIDYYRKRANATGLIIVEHESAMDTLLFALVILILIIGYYIINITPRERPMRKT